jgi:hypothetical protein
MNSDSIKHIQKTVKNVRIRSAKLKHKERPRIATVRINNYGYNTMMQAELPGTFMVKPVSAKVTNKPLKLSEIAR